jgi:hypothetical protein
MTHLIRIEVARRHKVIAEPEKPENSQAKTWGLA